MRKTETMTISENLAIFHRAFELLEAGGERDPLHEFVDEFVGVVHV